MNRYTLYCFAVFVCLILITLFYNWFNRTLENVQNYHHRYLEIKESFSFDEMYPLFCLRICILCGILYANRWSFQRKLETLIDQTVILQGRNDFDDPQRFGYITRVSNTTIVIGLCSTSNICDSLLNIDSQLIPFDSIAQHGKIHKGYFRRINALMFQVISFL